MRRPLRHTLSALHAAGIKVDHVRHAGRHTEVVFANGELYRMSLGNHPSRAHERRLRTFIRRHSETSA